ncbi:MAG TPA: aspartate carbamoyltransferase catalytic subunit [Clostridiaceae bacterium]|nr:aspartate carbamoyltransferase catalytic subunit [Clostridiaceae bacterium]
MARVQPLTAEERAIKRTEEAAVTQLTSQHLLGMQELSPAEINLILDTAFVMKNILSVQTKKTAHLQGRSVITFFAENSTRTRLSFDMACKYLGATTASIGASDSSIRKGENLYDTVKTLEMMSTDILVIRHSQSGAPHYIAERIDASVINAGDGMNEHPTQALLDMMTMIEYKGAIKGLKVAIIGDAMHSRVMRSNVWGLSKVGAEVRVAAPPTMIPRFLEQMPCQVCHDVREACAGVDIIMGLRVQLERQLSALFPSVNEYAHFFGIDKECLDLAKPDALIMHPGPCNHGVEMPTFIHEHERSVIHEQVANGVSVRMAVLFLLNAKRNAKLEELAASRKGSI